MGQTSANTSLIHTRPNFRDRHASTSFSPQFQLLPRATNNNDIAETGSDDVIISSISKMNLAPSNSISSLAEYHVSQQHDDQPSPPAATDHSKAAAAVTPAVAAAVVTPAVAASVVTPAASATFDANNTHNNYQVFPSLLHSQPESEPASLFPFPETEKQHDFPIEEMDESLPPPDYLADATLLENN